MPNAGPELTTPRSRVSCSTDRACRVIRVFFSIIENYILLQNSLPAPRFPFSMALITDYLLPTPFYGLTPA